MIFIQDVLLGGIEKLFLAHNFTHALLSSTHKGQPEASNIFVQTSKLEGAPMPPYEILVCL